MLEKVRRTIAANSLLSKGEKVILGFSGGIDSVCLAHVLTRLQEYHLELWAIYVNYGLRPAENRLEEELLRKTGERLGIQTVSVPVNIPEYLREKSQSVQLLARKERYRIFQDYRVEVGADKIALGHHRDDQAETVFYRIIRGTGIDGLAGMALMRDGIFIRPLLQISRAEIRAYAVENKLNWVEDSSNQKTVYRRNRIRHQLIPAIEETMNPRFKDALLRLGELAGEHHQFMESLVIKDASRLVFKEPNRVGFPLREFLNYPKYLQYYFLKHILADLRPDISLEMSPLIKLRERLNAENTHFKMVHLYKGIAAYVEDQTLFLGNHPGFGLRVNHYAVSCPGTTAIPEINLNVHITKDPIPEEWDGVSLDEAYLPIDVKLPLTIRFWRRGDRFWPLGAGGMQKLQDFFINRKVPRSVRGGIPLLTDADGNILWIAGYRLDERYKIRPGHREGWHITMTPFGP